MFANKNRSTRVGAAAAILGAMVFAAPVCAASSSDMPASSSNDRVAVTSSPETMAKPAAESPSPTAVEARIKELHRKLKSRAALEGTSLSDYLLNEIRRVAERPTLQELAERLGTRTPVNYRISPARILREERSRR